MRKMLLGGVLATLALLAVVAVSSALATPAHHGTRSASSSGPPATRSSTTAHRRLGRRHAGLRQHDLRRRERHGDRQRRRPVRAHRARRFVRVRVHDLAEERPDHRRGAIPRRRRQHALDHGRHGRLPQGERHDGPPRARRAGLRLRLHVPRARLEPAGESTPDRTRSRRGRAGRRPPSAGARRRPARAGRSRRRAARARPAAARSRSSSSQSVRSSTVADPDAVDRHAVLDVVAVPASARRRARRRRGSRGRRRVRAAPCRRRRRRDPAAAAYGVAARQHDVGAEAAHELLVCRARVGEHAQPAPLRERDHVRREQPGAAGDEQRRACGEVEQLEAAQAVSPFIGSVAACSSVAPAGIGTTDARRHDERAPPARRPRAAAAAPRPSPRRRPRAARRPAPTDSTVPAASMPGTHGGAHAVDAALAQRRCPSG